MPELRLQQLQFEIGAIKRLLSFMMEENVHLKNRISEILKNNFEKILLGKIEVFHNRFIMEDEIIGILRNNIAELDKILQAQKLLQDEYKIHDMGKKIRQLSVNIENTQGQFMLLKTEFNNFLLENTEAYEKV
ncbi:hypothetical protein [Ferruginibacter sp. SUN106]|uniref:hypothetical protein n=1 Tax=Ferruginibacter sp. SUN106 TaxID=2978348 RepID=UPI003D35B4C2